MKYTSDHYEKLALNNVPSDPWTAMVLALLCIAAMLNERSHHATQS